MIYRGHKVFLYFPNYSYYFFFSRKIKHLFYLEKYFQGMFSTGCGNLFLHVTYIFIQTDFIQSSRKVKTWCFLCRLASCYCNKRMKDQTTQKGAGHAWRQQQLKDKNIKHQLRIRDGCSVNEYSWCSFVYTQENFVSPHSVLNLENTGSLVRKNLF